MNDCSQYLSLEHVKNGNEGYTQYALEYPLRNRIICVDVARNKVKYKDSDNNIVSDMDMAKLMPKISKSIEPRNTVLTNEYMNEIQQRIERLTRGVGSDEMNEREQDNFLQQTESLTDMFFKIKKYRDDIKKVLKERRVNCVPKL